MPALQAYEGCLLVLPRAYALGYEILAFQAIAKWLWDQKIVSSVP